MGKKQLVINLIANIISVFVSLAVSFLLTPYIISSLGKEAYSFYPIANNFVSYMAIITLALNSMASRFITIEMVKKNIEKSKIYFSSVFFANFILDIILLIPMLLIVIFIDSILNVPTNIIGDVRILFICVFVAMLVNIITSVFGVATFAKNRMDWQASREIGQNIIRAILFFVLFYFFKPTIIYLGIVSIVLATFNGFVQFVFTRVLMPEYHISIQLFEWNAVKELVESGVWNSINNLGSILLMSVSLVIANKFISASTSGDLSIVQTLPNFMTTIICAIYGVMLPRISTVYAEGDKNSLIEEVKFSQKVLGVISTVPVILIILLGKEFFQLWVPKENASYLQVLSIITIIPLLVHSSMWTVYGLNVTNNKLKFPAIILIVVGIINVVLTYFFLKITDIGIYIIPILSSFTSTVYYLFFIPIYASKELDVSKFTFYPHIIRTILYAVFMVAVGYIIKGFMNIETWLEFFACGVLFELIGVVIYIIFILDRKDVKRILKEYSKKKSM